MKIMVTPKSSLPEVDGAEGDRLKGPRDGLRMPGGLAEFARRRCPLLLLLPLLFYVVLPTCNYYWDGIAFSISIEKRLSAAYLLHPSHLIYSLVGAWLYGLSEAVGIHTRALFVLQSVNSVLSGLCILLFYCYLRLRNLPATLSVPAALIFAFSATWWRFATDANAYVPSIFLLLCISILIERRKPVVLAGLVQACALLFHELALLFLPVALYRLRKSRRDMFTYTATSLIPVALAYVAAYRTVSTHMSVSGFLSWVTYHSSDSAFYFNPLTDAFYSIRGTLRLLFGGKLGDLLRDGISQAAIAVLVITIPAFLVCLWRTLRAKPMLAAPPRHLMIWAGSYVAFLSVWMPQNTFYRLYYLPALVAIIAFLLRDAPGTQRAVWLFVPVLMAWNFCFVVYPQSHTNFNAPLHFALAQKNTWRPGTPIVFRRFHPDLWTISYFNLKATWIELDQPDVGELELHLADARKLGTPLWLEETAYLMLAADPIGQKWLTEHERPGELLEGKDDKHDFRFHSIR